MNTGQKLVELSGLSSGSALAHLLAITQGTGTGVDKVVFASQMTVCLENDQFSVVSSQRKEPVVSAKEATFEVSRKENRLYSFYTPSSLSVLTASNTLCIESRPSRSVAVLTRPKEVSVKRRRRVTTL